MQANRHGFFYHKRRDLKKIVLIFFLLFSLGIILNGQEIKLDCVNVPLNKVLIQMRDNYGLQLSFSDKQLSKHRLTVNRKFGSPQEAVAFVLKDLPLDFEIYEGVIIIFPKREEESQIIRQYRLSGTIQDIVNSETLPYAHILINQQGLVSDVNGHFNYLSKTDSIFKLKISCLGYYVLDTIVGSDAKINFNLHPSTIGLSEVVIKGKKIARVGQVGESVGTMRLNHKVSNFLPGNGDNSVYNLLRLQPGILAAGESSQDFIIWGAYEGQSRVFFDGISLFGLKNFNDNISVVNPFMVKDIIIKKGGYGAEFGEAVGGIVNISGTSGNYSKSEYKLNVDNYTVNGMANFRISERSALMLAYRQTYYNLYDQEKLSELFEGVKSLQNQDITVFPDYKFQDFNVKYSGKTQNGDVYYLSYMRGKDDFSYLLQREVQRQGQQNQTLNFDVRQDRGEANIQTGGAVYLGKKWKKGNTTDFLQTYSKQDTRFTEETEVTLRNNGNKLRDFIENIENSIEEYKTSVGHRVVISENNHFRTGAAFLNHQVDYLEDSAGVIMSQNTAQTNRLNFYVEDELFIGEKAKLTIGSRIDYPFKLKKAYLQPRLAFSLNLSKTLKYNVSTGIYRQFISRASFVDDFGNYRYFWTICDNVNIPVLKSIHLVNGLQYTKNDLTISAELYSRTTEGITRFVRFRKLNIDSVFQGNAKSIGLDVFIKKEYRGHSAWISYTLGRTLEHFSYFTNEEYRRAPHDQKHEIKFAALFNLSPFYISANYVYGSGFPDPNPNDDQLQNIPYSRLDAAFLYKFPAKRFNLIAGLSVLNVLNTDNLKFSNFERVPYDQVNSINLYSQAVPFTPTLFLNLKF